ncbi:hypothetical protein POTOM_060014 [Populus tomentosa]|uniref:Uncharacterized protein n=1 Tax=Populus tomentosa TaxID=118781 RepID=A0A8X8BZ86_POPTO|nr:hypothetical protein POTOM_060014 [Populus tomentosa]
MADHNNSTTATPTITTSSTDPPIPLVALTSGFIDGTNPCPDRTSATFSPWMRQDQLLLHAIRISVSDSIAPLIASTTASKEAWDKLTRLYASHSRSRVMSLKERLVRPRDSSSLNEYLLSIKTIDDELELIDTPIFDDDITIDILNGVGHDFKELTAGIRAREHPISYEELHDKLINYEAYLKREDSQSTSSILSTNATQRYNLYHGQQSTWSSNRKAPHNFHPQSSWSTSRQFTSPHQASPWQSSRNNYQRRGYKDVTPLSPRLKTIGAVMAKIFPRNTTIPTSKTKVFFTATDEQTVVETNAYQGEREFVRDSKFLGSFLLEGIPAALLGVPRIEVKFDIDANKILYVTAIDKGTRKKQDITITGTNTLPSDEV